MKNIELYYKAILEFLEYVIDTIRYNEENGDSLEQVLEHLLEQELAIRKEKRIINELKNNTSKYENMTILETIIKDISENINIDKIYYNFKILEGVINRINELLDELETEELDFIEEEYDSQKFKLEVVSKDEYFCKELKFMDEEQNVLIALDFDKCSNEDENFESIIGEINSIEVLINILEKVDFKLELKREYCIITDIDYSDVKIIFNYIDMIQVYKGNTIHEPKESRYRINLINKCMFESIEKYVQFSDIIYILSEFNEEQNILNKYLKAYQIIENFMFRIPICELIDDSERMFTIRDFNLLYSKIDNNEKDAIKKFFNKALLEEDSNGKKLISIVRTYIDVFKQNNVDKLQLIKTSIVNKKFLSEIDLNNIKNLQDIETNKNCRNNLISVISKLIYGLRNSIVHNKATEFHLINSNLDDNLACFIDELVIPTLIEIIFFLIINRCRCITYQSDKLCLYN